MSTFLYIQIYLYIKIDFVVHASWKLQNISTNDSEVAKRKLLLDFTKAENILKIPSVAPSFDRAYDEISIIQTSFNQSQYSSSTENSKQEKKCRRLKFSLVRQCYGRDLVDGLG